VPCAPTAKVAVLPAVTVTPAGWVRILGAATLGGVACATATVSRAARERTRFSRLLTSIS
jgi:hypothetical protein